MRILAVLAFAAALFGISPLVAVEHTGQVMFQGMPVPGATVTAEREEARVIAISDADGFYRFPDLREGSWTIKVEMFGFVTVQERMQVAADAPAGRWELTLLSLEQVRAAMRQPDESTLAKTTVLPAENGASHEDELSESAADGLLIRGSMNSGESPLGRSAAFGNFRMRRQVYNAALGVVLGNSNLDARPFSLTGQNTPRLSYGRTTANVSLGGPLRIPGLWENGPNFFAGYQWTRNRNATAATALVPAASAREGVLGTRVIDPMTGAPFPGNVIPGSRVSLQAESLLGFYPMPNFGFGTGYNFQVPILNPTNEDALQSRVAKMLDVNNQVFGSFSFQSTRMDNPNLFGFLSTSALLGINASSNWSHRFSRQWLMNLGLQYSRMSARVIPYFANRENVSGLAGISGNDQDPNNWGPPTVHFASGIASLSDSRFSHNRHQTSGVTGSMLWTPRTHNISVGGDFRRLQSNYLGQEDPRGTFTFTGQATGSDFADFLLGLPAASSIAFGNADKYFRHPAYGLFFADDWRVSPALTLNAGLRWDYEAPITERYGRLVNLEVAPEFRTAEPAVGNNPVQPYRSGFSPRLGMAWRPRSGSSLIVRAGYGIYYDTSIYQAMAQRLAQQPPLSKAFNVQSSGAHPLSLANGFTAPAGFAGNTFGVDPSFRPGYAQTWNVSVQRDLPWALQMTATYLGTRGAHAIQAFLPNTFPAGMANPCPTCPTGFVYLTSNGNSLRDAAQLQVRRRLRSGLSAALQYTFAKAIDNAATLGNPGAAGSPQPSSTPAMPGGESSRSLPAAPTGGGALAIAQNWLDVGAERSRSIFDQRHSVSAQAQYTTGMGFAGGTLFQGWKGALYKDWTIATQITAGTGLPQTPIFLAPAQGTGITGTIRPDYTGAPLYAAPAGMFLNPGAFAAPLPGQWGNAGRNIITGPAQFLLNASLARTFRTSDRLSLDLRLDSTNALNRVNFAAWNTIINSAQFGLPAAANPMRTVQVSLRARF